MDKTTISRLREDSRNYAIAEEVSQLVTSSTLSLDALRFLGTLLERSRPRTIVEFGSGLSTYFLCLATASRPETTIYSIDHSPYYLEKTRERLKNFIQVKTCCCHPKLVSHAGKFFVSYDNQRLRCFLDGVSADIVLIDGPTGAVYGREAVLYQVSPCITRDSLIVLDDAGRVKEQEALGNWKRVWGAALQSVHLAIHRGLEVLWLDPAMGRQPRPFGVGECCLSLVDALRTRTQDILGRKE